MRKHPLLLMGLVVGVLVALGHAWSIPTGLFLDDHAHYRQLRDGDWSYRSAVAAARLGIVGDVMDLWSNHEAGLRFYRPVAFWLMRVEYTLGGWRPAIMHVFSLAWHVLCSMLVGWLAWRLIGRWFWATVAAGLLAVHPGHTATVYWIACQTELMATAFILLATLSYARHAGWWCTGGRTGGQAASGTSGQAASGTPRPGAQGNLASSADKRPRRIGWLVLSLLFFALAMGCREHAIMWPALIVVGDVVFRAGWRRHVWAYVAMAVLAIAYLLARQEALGGFPLPGRPYLMEPNEPGFVRYIADKFIYYSIGLFGYIPVLPITGMEFLRQRPAMLYGSFVGAAAGVALIFATSPWRRRLLMPLAWMTVFMLPLLPVFASCHHLYLPGVGMACLLAAGLGTLAGDRPGGRALVAGLLVIVHAVGLSLATWASGWAYCAGTRVEDAVVRDVIEEGRPLEDGDHLFFINVPMLAYYAVPAIGNEPQTGLGDRRLHGHILTFSPWLLRMSEPGYVDRVGDKTLIVTAPAGVGYFGGAGGRTLLAAMGLPETLAAGERFSGPLFDVEVLDADAEGVRRLRFEFRQPLDSPEYHFYFGSPVRWAYPLWGPGKAG
ncbi:MAG: hypothetical protein JXA69_06410 [Phycisphaerae bacterium]|nr:hypothetical protein [Phycisphaerae bacterium]